MRTKATPSIRTLLRDSPDGLDVWTIASTLSREPHNVRRLLKTMPDAYIDRWVRSGSKGMPSAVWCVVVPPENCPRPRRRND